MALPADHALREQVDDFQRDAIRRALTAHDGNWATTARALGLFVRRSSMVLSPVITVMLERPSRSARERLCEDSSRRMTCTVG